MVADISMVGGKAEAITTLRPAWWDRDGEYNVDHHLTSEEIWGEHGLLNFQYALRPVFDEKGKEIPGYLRSVRTDTGTTVGCGMTDRYKIVQPRDAFGWMDSLQMDGIMRYASAGVLKDGKEIWLLGVIPDDGNGVGRHKKYILWRDRFDAAGSILWFPCATRVECANTLSMAIGEMGSAFCGIRHTGDMSEKLGMARNAILEAQEAFAKYNADSHKLVDASYTPAQAQEYVATLFPKVTDDDGRIVTTGRAASIRERKVAEVRRAFQHPSNNVDGMGGTFWQLFNSVTYAVDHGNVFTFKGKAQARADNRFRALMIPAKGNAADLKQKAFSLAVEMAA